MWASIEVRLPWESKLNRYKRPFNIIRLASPTSRPSTKMQNVYDALWVKQGTRNLLPSFYCVKKIPTNKYTCTTLSVHCFTAESFWSSRMDGVIVLNHRNPSEYHVSSASFNPKTIVIAAVRTRVHQIIGIYRIHHEVLPLQYNAFVVIALSAVLQKKSSHVTLPLNDFGNNFSFLLPTTTAKTSKPTLPFLIPTARISLMHHRALATTRGPDDDETQNPARHPSRTRLRYCQCSYWAWHFPSKNRPFPWILFNLQATIGCG